LPQEYKYKYPLGSDDMADVTMSLEEYETMRSMIMNQGSPAPGQTTLPSASAPKKRSRSARASDKLLSKAFKEANARYRLKDGSLRKGRTQADIARLAQKLRKQMAKK
jgi:hypothetical protein